MNKEMIKNKLMDAIAADRILCDEPMKNHISFKVGGPADFLVVPESCEEVINVLACCRKNNLPF